MKKTRNIMLLIAIFAVMAYTVANCLFGILNAHYNTVFQFDATQTSEWFEFWKWVVISGATITVAKTVKGSTNSDDDENNKEETNDTEPKG